MLFWEVTSPQKSYLIQWFSVALLQIVDHSQHNLEAVGLGVLPALVAITLTQQVLDSAENPQIELTFPSEGVIWDKPNMIQRSLREGVKKKY